MEIDCFVLVACPENSVMESKEFYRPIVTPFELEIALVRGKEWSSEYTADFTKVLENQKNFVEVDEEEQEETRFSIIDGSLKINHKRQTIESPQDVTDRTLATRAEGPLINYTAKNHFLNRTFRGLEQNIGETPVQKAILGGSGIASSYNGEGSSKLHNTTTEPEPGEQETSH